MDTLTRTELAGTLDELVVSLAYLRSGGTRRDERAPTPPLQSQQTPKGGTCLMLTCFKVHIGSTLTGRSRYRTFSTLADASAFCGRIFEATGIVLSIVERRKP